MPGKKILVIDYDPQSIESTKAPLLDAGFRVEVATDGIEGLKAFARLRPDLVLIEPMVPKKHGFQVCQEIKRSPSGKQTPVLITTAFYRGRKHKMEAQRQYGCDEYLEKPIAADLLLSTCRRFLIDLHRPADAEIERQAPPEAMRRTIGSSEPAASAPIPALEDLTDDELMARLDAMILDGGVVDEATPVERATPLETAPAALPIVFEDDLSSDATADPVASVDPPRPALVERAAAPIPRAPAPVLAPATPRAPSATVRRSSSASRVARPPAAVARTAPTATAPVRRRSWLPLGIAVVVALAGVAGWFAYERSRRSTEAAASPVEADGTAPAPEPPAREPIVAAEPVAPEPVAPDPAPAQAIPTVAETASGTVPTPGLGEPATASPPPVSGGIL